MYPQGAVELNPEMLAVYRRKEALEKLSQQGSTIGAYEFDVSARHFEQRGNPTYCWGNEAADPTKWSQETVPCLQCLSPNQIYEA